MQGIPAGDGSHKISVYTNDIMLYVSDPLISVPILLKCLKDYSVASGYTVNEATSEAMMLVKANYDNFHCLAELKQDEYYYYYEYSLCCFTFSCHYQFGYLHL